MLPIHHKVLRVKVTNESDKGNIGFISRIDLTPLESSLPFIMKRWQFPLVTGSTYSQFIFITTKQIWNLTSTTELSSFLSNSKILDSWHPRNVMTFLSISFHDTYNDCYILQESTRFPGFSFSSNCQLPTDKQWDVFSIFLNFENKLRADTGIKSVEVVMSFKSLGSIAINHNLDGT